MGKPKFKPVCLSNGDRLVIAQIKTVIDGLKANDKETLAKYVPDGDVEEFSEEIDELVLRANPVPYVRRPRGQSGTQAAEAPAETAEAPAETAAPEPDAAAPAPEAT